jgi:hypothetical protein
MLFDEMVNNRVAYWRGRNVADAICAAPSQIVSIHKSHGSTFNTMVQQHDAQVHIPYTYLHYYKI